MQYTPVFIILITLLSCRNDVEMVDLTQTLNEKSCMYSVLVDTLTKYTHFEREYVIEVVSPTFKEEIKKYSKNDLNNFKTATDVFLIPIQEKYSKFILKNRDKTSILSSYEDGFMACKIEVPTKFGEFTEKHLEGTDYEIKYRKLITKAKLIKKEKSFSQTIRTDSVMSFRKGYYTPILEVVSGGYKSQMDFVFKLQRKLNQKGYYLKETGLLDERTRSAIKEFQKVSNLEENDLNNEFFEILEFDKK